MGTLGVCPTQPREIQSRRLASPNAITDFPLEAASLHRISAPIHKVQRHSSTSEQVPQQLWPLRRSSHTLIFNCIQVSLLKSLASFSKLLIIFRVWTFFLVLLSTCPSQSYTLKCNLNFCLPREAGTNKSLLHVHNQSCAGQTCWLCTTQSPLLPHSHTVRALQNHAPGTCK